MHLYLNKNSSKFYDEISSGNKTYSAIPLYEALITFLYPFFIVSGTGHLKSGNKTKLIAVYIFQKNYNI